MSTISVLSEEETRVTGENHRPAASHWQTSSHNVLSSTPRHERDSNWQLSGDRHWLHRYVYIKFLLSGVQVNAFSSHKACKSSQILIYISITSISNLSCCGGDYFDKLLYTYIYLNGYPSQITWVVWEVKWLRSLSSDHKRHTTHPGNGPPTTIPNKRVLPRFCCKIVFNVGFTTHETFIMYVLS